MSKSYKGFFITLEGPECSGKSTNLRRIAEYLREKGMDVLVMREPGGDKIAEEIGGILRSVEHKGKMSNLTEALLFQAARAQICEKFVWPNLREGKIIISDRFSDSTRVYQGMVRGLGRPLVEELNRLSTKGLTPDLTYLFDLPHEESLRRIEVSGKKERIDLESPEFHKRIREGYHELVQLDNMILKRWVVIDANRHPDEVFTSFKNDVELRLAEAGFIERANYGKENRL